MCIDGRVCRYQILYIFLRIFHFVLNKRQRSITGYIKSFVEFPEMKYFRIAEIEFLSTFSE